MSLFHLQNNHQFGALAKNVGFINFEAQRYNWWFHPEIELHKTLF